MQLQESALWELGTLRCMTARTGLFVLFLSFCTGSCNQWSCCYKTVDQHQFLSTFNLKLTAQKMPCWSPSSLCSLSQFIAWKQMGALWTSFLPPLHICSAVPTWQDSCLTASCLFLVWKSLESCSLVQGATHRDIQGSPMIKSASTPALSVPHSFSCCPHFPVSPNGFHLLRQLWSQQWGCLTLTCKWQGRSFQPAWEMEAETRTFAGGCAWGWFESHLCACLVLLAVGSEPRLAWNRDQSEKTADPVLCSLSCMMANCQLLITFQYFPF